MLDVATSESVDEAAWSWRSSLWGVRAAKSDKPQKARRTKQPLVLCGRGVSLKIEQGSLLVRNGFTHFPQEREEFRLFRGSLDNPPQIVMLDGSGHLTFDVLNWLSEQDIVLTRITWNGDGVTVVGGSGYSANPHRVQWQLKTRQDASKRAAWCTDLIYQKIEGCVRTLEKILPRSDAWENAMSRAYSDLSVLELRPPSDVGALRIIEANSAAAYFRAWRGLSIKWRGLSRYPIPDEWRSIGSRTSDFSLAGNRNASHPVNAIMNYAYAVLESRTRIQAIANGFDPRLGIMHETRPDGAAFVFDIMEPERPTVDQAILTFIKGQVFHPSDFILRMDGVVRLNPQLARRVVQIVSKERALPQTVRLTSDVAP